MDSIDQTSKAYTTTFLQLNNRLRRLLRRLEVDRAVFFGLLAKIWGLCVAPITAILIATKFTPELQGYYFTFTTILALRVFVELGLGTVIVQFAGHEWAKLNLDESGHIVGDRNALSRLVSIADIASKWYLFGSIIVALGLGIGGFIFFSDSHYVGINWTAPWFLLCFVSGINVCLVPVWSLLEGCNQVAQLYTFRFYQGVVSNIAVWIAILFGAGLWTASISGIAILLCSIFFLKRRYWAFLKSLLLSKPKNNYVSTIAWRTDMLPMQWRIALTMMSGYFVFSFFVPVLFKFQGPVIAGQMGMTLGIIIAIGNLSFAWFTPKIPQFCMLVAGQRYKKLDRVFFHNTKITLKLLILGSLSFLVGIYLINKMGLSIASRLLPPLPAGIFLLANVVVFASAPFSHYMRAHKREPIVFVVVLSSLLTGVSTFITGKYYTINLMLVSYLIINIGMTTSIVLIWYYCRSKWQKKC